MEVAGSQTLTPKRVGEKTPTRDNQRGFIPFDSLATIIIAMGNSQRRPVVKSVRTNPAGTPSWSSACPSPSPGCDDPVMLTKVYVRLPVIFSLILWKPILVVKIGHSCGSSRWLQRTNSRRWSGPTTRTSWTSANPLKWPLIPERSGAVDIPAVETMAPMPPWAGWRVDEGHRLVASAATPCPVFCSWWL